MAELVDRVFRPAFDNPLLATANDQATFPSPGERLAMTTDSYVVSPLFFPGGNIGSLAVHGTVNDLAMGGAQPRYLSAAFVLEEGLPLAELVQIAETMGAAARDAGVQVVTGDSKVVERGKGDGVFLNTTGIGVVDPGADIDGSHARPGDRVILSGPLGDHGVAVMALRQGLAFADALVSDSRPLHRLVAAMLARAPGAVHALRDPTRGGLAAALNELARQSGVGIRLDEAVIPVRDSVRGACELLGLDPLHVANEGKLVAIVASAAADDLVAALRALPGGEQATVIGEVVDDPGRLVCMTTVIGGERVVDWLWGEQLPRIC